MGNTDGNTVVESTSSLNASLHSWKTDCENYVYLDKERKSESVSPCSNNGDKQLSKMCTSLRGEVIAFHTNAYPKPEVMNKSTDAVDLRAEKNGDRNNSENREDKHEETASVLCMASRQRSPTKLKFGIDSILDKESKSDANSKEGSAGDIFSHHVHMREEEIDERRSPPRNNSESCNENHKDRSSLSQKKMHLEPQWEKHLSGVFAEQYKLQVENSRKLQKQQAKKIAAQSFKYHPYMSKMKSSFTPVTSDGFSAFSKSRRCEEKFRQNYDASNRKLVLESPPHSLSKCSFEARESTSGENSLHVPPYRGHHPAAFIRRSPIYKSSAMASLHPRPKSLTSPPCDIASTRSSSKEASSPRSEQPPFCHSSKAMVEPAEHPFKNRRSIDSDEVFNDEASLESPASSHFPSPMLKQHRLSSPNENSPSSPSPFFPVPENRKEGSSSCISPINGDNLPPFPFQLSSPLNYHSWQQAMASTYNSHFRNLFLPYAYGQAATLAMASALRPKSLRPPPLIMAGGHQMSLDPSRISYDLQDSLNEHHLHGIKEAHGSRKRRKWNRAVFSARQRQGLEESFQVQKYVAKPERRVLADRLGLTDAQVKIWFQNRRMKWRQEQKSNKTLSVESEELSPPSGEENCIQPTSQ